MCCEHIEVELVKRGFEFQVDVSWRLVAIFGRGNTYCVVQDWTNCNAKYGYQVDLYHIEDKQALNNAVDVFNMEYIEGRHAPIVAYADWNDESGKPQFYKDLGDKIDFYADKLESKFAIS